MQTEKFKEILEDVEFGYWRFRVGEERYRIGDVGWEVTGWYLQVVAKEQCTTCNGKGGYHFTTNILGDREWDSCKDCQGTGHVKWTGRKWRLSKHMTKSEVVQTALASALAAVEHEAREKFKYKGESIFDPHYDVDKLHQLRSEDCLDVRAVSTVKPVMRSG